MFQTCHSAADVYQIITIGTSLESQFQGFATGLALNGVRCSENAKSVRKCVRFGLACVRLHGSVRFVFGSVFVFMFVFMFVFGVRVHVRGPILRKSTNSTHGKRAPFSQSLQK